MTPDEAADLAARVLAAIDKQAGRWRDEWLAADRERVASDLAGIKHHEPDSTFLTPAYCMDCGTVWPCDDATRYADGLRRTAALYGVPVGPATSIGPGHDTDLWDDKADAARAEYLRDDQ